MQQTVRERPAGHRRNTALYIGVAAVVVAVVVVVVLLAGSGTRGMVEVPDLTGKNVDAATDELAGLELGLKEHLRVPDDSVPEGVIISQLTEPGSLLKKQQDTVLITVSRGPVKVVPQLAGFKREEAGAELQKSGLVLGKTTTETSAEFPPGRIIRMEPDPGSELMRGQPVNIVTSIAPPPPPVPRSFQRPSFALTSVEVESPDANGFNLAVGISATNINRLPGRIRAFYYILEVDTFRLASMRHLCDMTLPADGTASGVLSVNIRHDRLGRAAAAMLSQGRVRYRVRGYYTLEAEGGRSTEHVSVSGDHNVAENVGPLLRRLYGQQNARGEM